MKLIATLFLLTAGLTVSAQHSNISKEVNDDGTTLSIRIDAGQDGHSWHYKRDFDVSGMNSEKKRDLEIRIVDSLGIAHRVRAPRAPRQPIPARAPRRVTPTTENDCDAVAQASSGGYTRPVAMASTDSRMPYTKSVEEDLQTGRMRMRYEFNRDGVPHTYERTVEGRGKSEREKQRIIDETEKELGLSPLNARNVAQ